MPAERQATLSSPRMEVGDSNDAKLILETGEDAIDYWWAGLIAKAIYRAVRRLLGAEEDILSVNDRLA